MFLARNVIAFMHSNLKGLCCRLSFQNILLSHVRRSSSLALAARDCVRTSQRLLFLKMSCISVSNLSFSPTKGKGQIQVILGPMFSGKSTELMRRIRRYQVAKQECLVIKYAKDTRYSVENLSTHDQQSIPAIKATKLKNISSVYQFSVIGVDEGQFFDDIVEFCEALANQGKIVIVAALDGTFERKPFGSILNLIPFAENVVKLSAVCNSCFREAAFTKRISEEKEVEVIGGSDKYLAVCRRCYHKILPSQNEQHAEEIKKVCKSLDLRQNRVPFSPVTDKRVNHSFKNVNGNAF